MVTDLSAEKGELAWYRMRFRREDEDKDHKSGGWGWHHTRMEDPKRAERRWLAMAVAMQRAVLVGELEKAKQEEQQSRQPQQGKPLRRGGRPATYPGSSDAGRSAAARGRGA